MARKTRPTILFLFLVPKLGLGTEIDPKLCLGNL